MINYMLLNIQGTNDPEILKNIRYYVVMAVEHWIKEGDKAQITFFQEGLDLIDKKLKKMG
ncbi:hypothetical protein [Proteus terrae]|uniref:hypothetical protein n=1 Tax=Proteus terrae TaxID=1574161 RepID=UPI001C5F2120|nr:hypothetical protein [Proteus terrae]